MWLLTARFGYWHMHAHQEAAQSAVMPCSVCPGTRCHSLEYAAYASATHPPLSTFPVQVPNGELTAAQLHFLADCIKPYGADGCADITTRANIQLRGVTLPDAEGIIKGLWEHGLGSFQAGMDSVRNLTGNPIAGKQALTKQHAVQPARAPLSLASKCLHQMLAAQASWAGSCCWLVLLLAGAVSRCFYLPHHSC